jgi:predicted permease
MTPPWTLDSLEQDLRFAWRSLKRDRTLTALIVITLTLGIGVNAATFSLLDRIYLRPPVGVVHPEQMHRIWIGSRFENGPGFMPSMTYPMYRVIREAWGDTDQVALVNHYGPYRLGGTRRGAKISVLFATANYWSVLGLKPQFGRFYSKDEDRLYSGAPVAVISDHLWRTQFGADSSLIGKQIRLDEGRYTIVGVAPRGFIGDELDPVDVWMPLSSLPKPPWMKEPILASNAMFIFFAIARSTPNADLGSFDQRATIATRRFLRQIGNRVGDTVMTVTTGPIIFARGPGFQRKEDVIATRLGAVAVIVLLIASANVVNLLLGRASRRRREIAVRLALGVGRWRLVRMLTVESVLLALVAGTAAVVAAWWAGGALRSLLLPNVRFVDPAIDTRVATFTFVVAIVAGLFAGILPALQASNPDLTQALRAGAREGVVRRSRLRSSLIVTQAALAVVLLIGAALFVESLRKVRALDIGFDAPRVVIGRINFDPGAERPQPVVAQQVTDVAQRLEHAPGVQAVARTLNAPMEGFSATRLWIRGDSNPPTGASYPMMNVVTQNFFSATGLKMLRGTVFVDQPGAPRSVVINDAMARQLWPGRDPVGDCIRFDGRAGTCYVISGIVATAHRDEIIEDPKPQYYLPMSNLPDSLRQQWSNGSVLLVRSAPSAVARVEAEVTRALQRAFPAGYPDVHLLSQTLESQYRPWRVGAWLFTGLGFLALIVAVVGVYSTVSYAVTQRTHEFGVRLALGARVADVLRLVLGEELRTVLLGVAVGIVLAVAAGRLIASLLYDIAPGNPVVIATVSLTLLVAAAVATVIPAFRAARVDPIAALRAD